MCVGLCEEFLVENKNYTATTCLHITQLVRYMLTCNWRHMFDSCLVNVGPVIDYCCFIVTIMCQAYVQKFQLKK